MAIANSTVMPRPAAESPDEAAEGRVAGNSGMGDDGTEEDA